LRATVFSCCCFWLCFRNISFVLKLCIMSVGYPLVFAIARIIFHSFCFDFSVIGSVISLFM
jgi:hypothetical protein